MGLIRQSKRRTKRKTRRRRRRRKEIYIFDYIIRLKFPDFLKSRKLLPTANNLNSERPEAFSDCGP
jgi:hypothetical protein